MASADSVSPGVYRPVCAWVCIAQCVPGCVSPRVCLGVYRPVCAWVCIARCVSPGVCLGVCRPVRMARCVPGCVAGGRWRPVTGSKADCARHFFGSPRGAHLATFPAVNDIEMIRTGALGRAR